VVEGRENHAIATPQRVLNVPDWDILPQRGGWKPPLQPGNLTQHRDSASITTPRLTDASNVSDTRSEARSSHSVSARVPRGIGIADVFEQTLDLLALDLAAAVSGTE
jgi:hypothetical protein